jgi:chorismate lyase/3-hydroxybenzoate synthase
MLRHSGHGGGEGEVLSQVFRAPDPDNNAPGFAVCYAGAAALPAFFAKPQHLLAMAGFAAEAPPALPQDCPYLTVPLRATSGAPVFEIWTAAAPVRPVQTGSVRGACNDAIAFGVTMLDECYGLEAAAERAYLDIFDFLDRTGHKAPIRFWNYPVAITADDDGMERYRRFNIGRHRAFSARLQQKLPPAATGIGGHGGSSVIYFLAAHEPALPVENPRQVSAYAYPPIYGPRSPSFSRASIFTLNGRSCLFVSGTASIVGHETRHVGDLAGQIAETAENLRAVIGQAEKLTGTPMRGEWALKIYVHDAAAEPLIAPTVDAIFGLAAQRVYLRGDICRRELLVEIEAFRQF